MWPYKKDKGISIPPGKSVEIGFGVEWKRGKDEVVIISDKERFVLNGKNELFLEVTCDNADPVKVQIVPDFKKRVINVVEVINISDKQTSDKNKGKISFVGMDTSKDTNISIGELLKRWDESIEMFDKRIRGYKRRRNVFMTFAVVIAAGNMYLFTINDSPMKYLNIAAVTILAYASFRLWKSYKELIILYEEYKKDRSQVFETVKNT